MTQTQQRSVSEASPGAAALTVKELWKIFGDKADKIIGSPDADLSRKELQARTGCVAAVKDV
jgi:glycine betaine/proline transport system ATP-binding protein